MAVAPQISVVIATRNRAESLERLLAGLLMQVDAPDFEVVVADNGSADATASVVHRASQRMPIRYVVEPVPGKGRALNAAMALAAGALLVFTDDDVQPDPRWLAAWASAADRHPDTSVFGGRIVVDGRAVPRWVRRSHNLMGLLTSEHHGAEGTYTFGRYPFGPNMALRRDRLADPNARYPEDMGPGTAMPVGDESAFLMRISPPDATDRRYIPEAVVHHEVEAENVTWRAALARSYAQGRAQGRLRIPPGVSGPDGRQSFVGAALARLAACRSVRELACVLVRHAGYLRG